MNPQVETSRGQETFVDFLMVPEDIVEEAASN